MRNRWAGPSTDGFPATIISSIRFHRRARAGDGFTVFDNEASAREISMARQAAPRAAHLASCARPTYPDMLAKIKGDGAKELPLVIKADAHGSIEAITATVGRLANDGVGVRVLHAAVGGVNESESDVSLASASGAPIIRSMCGRRHRRTNSRSGKTLVSGSIRSFTSWVEDVPIALNGLLVLVRRERLLGYADVHKCSRFRESARSPDAWHPKVSSGAVPAAPRRSDRSRRAGQAAPLQERR